MQDATSPLGTPSGPVAIVRGHLNDPHRPRYHFLPPGNWINDPNGLIQKNGLTHLFYQTNPNGAFHGTIHWGHAVSRDLVHWEDLPMALSPTPGGPDKDGCWSGCAVDDHGTPTLLYTGLAPQVQCLATSHDGLRTWQKHPQPVIAAPPADLGVLGAARGAPEFRDPFVWREGDRWRMVLGCGLVGVGGAVLLYDSSDLRTWRYLGVLHSGRFAASGAVWECPNFFELGDKHVLLVSEQPEFKYTYVQMGRLEDHRFIPEVTSKLDVGPYFYAALSLQETQGRRLIWGWLKEGRSEAAQRRAGWSGVMSLPRQLSLKEGALALSPIPELETLRGEPQRWTDLTLKAQERTPAVRMAGNTFELQLRVELESSAAFELYVLSSPGSKPSGDERTVLRYDAPTQTYTVDALHASRDPEAQPEKTTVTHVLEGNRLSLRVFVDRSVVETFLDGRTCVASRVYPTDPRSDGVWVVCRRGTLKVVELTLWPMASIWP